MRLHHFWSKVERLSEHRLVYANPATRWATKFWNERAWADLADKLILELNSFVIFGGSSAELHYVHRIVSLMSQTPVVARWTP